MMACDSEIEGGRATTYTYVNARAGASSLVGRRDLCDSGAAAGGFRSGFRLGSNPFSRCGHERAFTYNYVKHCLEHAALHDLSASQSEAARSECVVHVKAASEANLQATNTRHGSNTLQNGTQYQTHNSSFITDNSGKKIICRFLSPDPYIHHPYYSQNFVRYSYVFNNPLKYTDPSGYRDKPLYRHDHQWVRRFNSVLNEVFGGGEYSLDDALNSPYWQLMSGVANGFAEETTGGAGGGAPMGGSAASGPGSGGGGGGPLVKAKKESFGNRYKLRRVPRGKTSDIAYFRNSGGIVKDSYMNNLEEKAGKYDWASRLYQKISNDLLIELAVSGNTDLTASESDSRSFKIPEYGKSVSFTPGDVYPGTNMSVSNNGNNILSVDGYDDNPPNYSGKSKAGDVMDVNLMRRQPAFNDFYAQPPTDLSFPGGGTTLITINVIPSFQFQLQCGLEY